MIDLYDLSPDELADLLTGWGEPGFRARQLSSWLYEKLSASFDAMTNLPASLRARLAQETTSAASSSKTRKSVTTARSSGSTACTTGS